MSNQPMRKRTGLSLSKKMKMRRRRTYTVVGFLLVLGIVILGMQLFSPGKSAEADTVVKPPEVIEEQVSTEIVPTIKPGSPIEEQIPMSSYNDGEKVAYLTIDDGPSAATKDLLDLLAKYNIKATFFMMEPRMGQYPDQVKRLVEEGHMPGMHGVTHEVKKVYASAQSVTAEMEAGRQKVKELTGFIPSLIRVPYGSNPHMKPDYKQAVQKAGFHMWDWNVDSLDWKLKNGKYVQYVLDQVDKLEKKGENPVILVHDTRGTVDHLSTLVEELIERGYTFELLHNRMEPLQFT